MPDIAGWRPAKDTHAIHMAFAAVNFAQPIGDVLWRKIDAALAPTAAALGLSDRQPVFAGLPAPIQAMLGGQQLPEHGVGYRKLERPDYFSEQVQATRDHLRYEQWEYTRWAPFQNRAQALMSPAVDRYCEVSELATITVQYVDVFHSIDGFDPLDVGAVIDMTGPGVARGAFRSSSAWHTHSGWFDYPDDMTRRLFTMNIDVLDQPRETGRGLAIQIVTQGQDQFGQEGQERLADGQADWNFVQARMDQLHVDLKGVLRQALTNQAAEAISLS